MSHRDVEAVLAGNGSYVTLHEREQAMVRTSWDKQIAEKLSSHDLAKEFDKAGIEWTEAVEDGSLVTRGSADA